MSDQNAPVLSPEWRSRGFLPHWEAGEVPQAITFRLYDSLPQVVLRDWKDRVQRVVSSERERAQRTLMEMALDRGYGSCWLRRPEIARVVERAFVHFDGRRYALHAWVVMPNHVHVLMTPTPEYTIAAIVHSWKSYTSKQANRILCRTGAFWQREYHDRRIRDETHYLAVLGYIEENPVRAGLCSSIADWPFGSARFESRRSRS